MNSNAAPAANRQADRRAISIGLVDNDPYALDYLRAEIERLSPSFHVIWAVKSGAAAVHRCLFTGPVPDVLVADVSLSDTTGAQVCRAIRVHGPRPAIIGITALDADAARAGMMAAGAQALIAKDNLRRQLPDAIRAAVRGVPRPTGAPTAADGGRPDDIVLDAQRTCAQLAGDGGTRTTPSPVTLSPQELTIMRLYHAHLSTGEIADRLAITPATVHVHVHHVMAKTHTSSRHEAIRCCERQHLL